MAHLLLKLKAGDIQVKKHKYCCQNRVQSYIDHMIDVPDDFSIISEKLQGLNKSDFIVGLKSLTELIKKLYENMILDPEGFGLPCVEDIHYSPFNPKAAESGNSSYRLIMFLYVLANSGILENDKLIIDKKKYQETNKKQKGMFKVSNTTYIFNKLSDFGFEIENFNGKTLDKKCDNFTISYKKHKNLITVLYGYMKDVQIQREPFMSFHYYLLSNPEDLPKNHIQNIFSEYFHGKEKDFYIELSNFLSELNIYPKYNGYAFSIDYLANPKVKQLFIRCFSDYRKISINLKLNFIDTYTEYLSTCPENVKQTFKIKSNCNFCQESCVCRRIWSFEGITYTFCTHSYNFEIADYNLKYINYYKQIIKYEIEARKNAKNKK